MDDDVSGAIKQLQLCDYRQKLAYSDKTAIHISHLVIYIKRFTGHFFRGKFDLTITDCIKRSYLSTITLKTMVLQNSLATPLSIQQLEEKFKSATQGFRIFLFDSSCLDIVPPLPPGADR